jgi:D-aspartate ligase
LQALIIHARRTGYGVIRSLYDLGVRVIVADDERTPVFHSNKVAETYVLPHITSVSNDEYLALLLELGKQNFTGQKILVFTGKDDYLLFFSKNYQALSKYFVLSFESDYLKLRTVLGKKSLSKIATAAGVKIPLTLTDESSDSEFQKISYPVIIKPDFKNLPDLDVVSKAFRLMVCRDDAELSRARQKLSSLGLEYVVQKYISGGDDKLFTVGTYFFNGKLLGYSMARKIRQFPMNTGECSFGELINDDSLVSTCSILGKETNLTGICQIEFKKMGEDYFLIEINPRVWSWHQIHTKAGVDLVAICAKKIFGLSSDEFTKPTSEIKGYWHFSLMDLLHNVILNRNVSFFHWLKDVFRADIHAFYSKDDLKPVFSHWRKTISYVVREVVKHQKK